MWELNAPLILKDKKGAGIELYHSGSVNGQALCVIVHMCGYGSVPYSILHRVNGIPRHSCVLSENQNKKGYTISLMVHWVHRECKVVPSLS